MFAEAAVRQVARDEGHHPGARGSRKRLDPGRTAYWAALSPFNRLVMNVPARIAIGPNATPAAHPPLPMSTSTNATAKHPAPRMKAIHCPRILASRVANSGRPRGSSRRRAARAVARAPLEAQHEGGGPVQVSARTGVAGFNGPPVPSPARAEPSGCDRPPGRVGERLVVGPEPAKGL